MMVIGRMSKTFNGQMSYIHPNVEVDIDTLICKPNGGGALSFRYGSDGGVTGNNPSISILHYSIIPPFFVGIPYAFPTRVGGASANYTQLHTDNLVGTARLGQSFINYGNDIVGANKYGVKNIIINDTQTK